MLFFDTLTSLPSPFAEIFLLVVLILIGAFLWWASLSTYLYWIQTKFKKDIKWITMEIQIPREIRKSPKAMEQVLASIHSLRNAPGDFSEWYVEGEVTRWYSLELVSFGGEAHYYIRYYYKQRPLIEASFFSYYPDVELVEVQDYALTRLPENLDELYAQGYDMWGTEMKLARPAVYPIKTYVEFEAIEEEKQFDPMSTFLEVLGQVKEEQFVGIQILIQPKNNDWRKEWEHYVEELRDGGAKKKGGGVTVKRNIQYPGDALGGAVGILPAIENVKGRHQTDPTESLRRSFIRTPGETDVLKAVEGNLSKPAFDTLIRFVYLSPKPMFYDSFARRGIVGSFNQYGALDRNSFAQVYKMGTRTRFWHFPYLFPNLRNETRKARLLYNFRTRHWPPTPIMGRVITSKFLHWNFSSWPYAMNTEVLATVYHPPSHLVLTAPHVRRVESRKTGAPAGLPIYGEEAEIEEFRRGKENTA